MLGLFDTVASAIESGRNGLRLKSHAFTSRNTSVESVSHAVAIVERRTMFRPQLWPLGQEYWGNPFNKIAARSQDAKEVWFAGGHGEVGGGYPEANSALGKVPLVWMIERGKRCGLLFRTQSVNAVVRGRGKNAKYVAPDPLAPAHETMTGAWPILEFIPQRMAKGTLKRGLFGLTLPLFDKRAIPSGAEIHNSVVQRREEFGTWAPKIPKDHVVERGTPT